MGVYLVSVGAQEWFGTGEDSYGELAAALNRELARRGLPPYESVPGEAPFVRGSGLAFEEKLVPPMDSFGALCEAHLSREQTEVLCGWTVLVPLSLQEEIWLPIRSTDSEESMIAGAWQVLTLAKQLAVIVELPAEVADKCDNPDLTTWFMEEAAGLAATRPGRWSEDLDAAFYVALFLRAAQHSLRRGCPIVCT